MASTTEAPSLTRDEKKALRNERKKVVATLSDIDAKLGENTEEPREPKGPSLLRRFGRKVIDTDLRDMGHAVRSVPSKLPRIEIARKDEEVVETTGEPTEPANA